MNDLEITTPKELLKSKENKEFLKAMMWENSSFVGTLLRISRMTPLFWTSLRKSMSKYETEAPSFTKNASFEKMVEESKKSLDGTIIGIFSNNIKEMSEPSQRFVRMYMLDYCILPLRGDGFRLDEDYNITYIDTQFKEHCVTPKKWLELINRNVNEDYKLSCKDIEHLANLIKKPQIELEVSNDVVKAYVDFENTGSCMAWCNMKNKDGIRMLDNGVPNYLEIFYDNPEVFKVLIIKMNGKMVGRRLMAKNVDGDIIVHKAYLDKNLLGSEIELIDKACEEFIDENDYYRHTDYISSSLELNYRVEEYEALPYMDIYRYSQGGDEYLHSFEDDHDFELNETDGRGYSSLECESCGTEISYDCSYTLTAGRWQGERRCEDCCVRIDFGDGEGEYVDEREAMYSEYNNGYCRA